MAGIRNPAISTSAGRFAIPSRDGTGLTKSPDYPLPRQKKNQLKGTPKLTEDDATLTAKGSDHDFSAVLQANAEKLLQRKHIDVSKLRELGSGQMGTAFAIGNGKVLKITTDSLEAKTSFKLRGKKHQHIAQFDDVFKFPNTEIYGIIQPQMEPLDAQERREYTDLTKLLSLDSKEGPGKDAYEVLATGTWEELVQHMGDVFAEEALSDGSGQMNVAKAVRNKLALFSRLATKYKLPEMMQELRQLGVRFADFHAGNLMKHEGRYVINDLGKSKVNGAIDPPQLESLVREFMNDLFVEPSLAPTTKKLGLTGFSNGASALLNPEDSDYEAVVEGFVSYFSSRSR